MEASFYFGVDCFFDNLFPGVQFSASGIQLCLDGRSQAFPEISNHNLIVRSCSGVKLSEDRLQVLQVGCPVEDFL